MTCIIGLLSNGVSYMGTDSLGSNGYTGNVYKNRKVFKLDNNKDIMAGYTSSFRMGQLLQYSSNLFDELNLLKNNIDEKYMVNKFIPNVQKLFEEGKYKEGGQFLLSFKDKLYEVQCDFSVLEPKDGFSAVGCGEDFAKSSLETTKNLEMSPIDRISKALECAEKYSIGVRRPFYIINSENDDVVEIK